MTYLATIAGNDYTKDIVRKNFDFPTIARFCCTLDSDLPEHLVHQKIAHFMRFDRSAISSVITSIKSYDINFVVEPIDDPIAAYCSSNVLMYAFYSEKIFQYEANFLDFKHRAQNSNTHSMLDMLIEVFRKLGGILLKGIEHENPLLKIVTKYSIDEKYTLKEHTPIYYPHGKPSLIFSQKSVSNFWLCSHHNPNINSIEFR